MAVIEFPQNVEPIRRCVSAPARGNAVIILARMISEREQHVPPPAAGSVQEVDLRLKKLIPGVIRKGVKSVLRRRIPLSRDAGDELTRKPLVSGLPKGMSPDVVIDFGPVRILSASPPVFLSGISYNEYLGIARAFAGRYGNISAGFVIFPTWTIERPGFPESMRRAFLEHVERYPNHVFQFICNSHKEAELLEKVGLPGIFLNKNFTVSSQIFYPIANAEVEFDAVYNAQFVPSKRHDLAAAIPRVGYITYVKHERRQEDFRKLFAEALARNPDHVLLNAMVDGRPARMSQQQVNAAQSRGAVGLLLSGEEGSSYASMEYLLAGLPVVSTPSKGGRDVFFDPEYCIVCKPDPIEVRDAVAAIRARGIPREVVRARTLAKIEPERERFLTMVDDMIERLGGECRYGGGGWPFGDTSGVRWAFFNEHLAELAKRRRRAGLGEKLALGAGALAELAKRRRAGLAKKLGLRADALADVQLEAQELDPIVAAIRERPGCALLVFGCGRDSSFWENVNRGGTTAFLEDNPKWAADARARLATATVHIVKYGTRVSEWRRLFDNPSELAMDLPAEIGSRRWDVILVDGPAGYDDRQPGRMKSIDAASRLVAPGGCVFVHDCERPVEQAFASRCLGDGRVFLEVRGRAVLRGYAF